MPAREKSDIVSGLGTGFEILKALRDGGAADDDLRRILSSPTVRDSVVRLLKAKVHLTDMIGRADETLVSVLREAVVNYRIPFNIGVRLGGVEEAVLCASSLRSLLGSKVKVEVNVCSNVCVWIMG